MKVCFKYYVFVIFIFNFYQFIECNTTVRSPIITNQDILKILQNIEDRLQVIDKIERKVDNINTRINRLENIFETRLEKIDSNINIKYDHVSRKIDTAFDRYIHRFNNHLESKIEKEMKKIETKIETNLQQLDRIENNFGPRQEIIETEIGESSEILRDIQLSIDNLHDNIKIENSTKNNLNKKMINMEKLLTENNYLLNTTRKECQDNTRSINALNRKTTNLNQNLLNDINKSLNGIGGMIQKKFSYVNQKIDNNFNNTMLAHNLFLESCHRIQLDEPQMEAKIVNVVETLLSLITNITQNMGHNITNIGGEIFNLQDLLQTHDSKIQDKVGLAKDTFQEMAQKSFNYKQETVQTLIDIKNNLNQWLDSTADILNNNQTNHFEKLDVIEKILQNVHNHIINLNMDKNHELETNMNKLIEFIEKNINTTNSITSTIKMEQHFENLNSLLNKIHDKIIEKQSNLRHNRSKITTNLMKHNVGKNSTMFETMLEPNTKLTENEIIMGNDTNGFDMDTEFNYSTDLTEDDGEDVDFTY